MHSMLTLFINTQLKMNATVHCALSEIQKSQDQLIFFLAVYMLIALMFGISNYLARYRNLQRLQALYEERLRILDRR